MELNSHQWTIRAYDGCRGATQAWRKHNPSRYQVGNRTQDLNRESLHRSCMTCCRTCFRVVNTSISWWRFHRVQMPLLCLLASRKGSATLNRPQPLVNLVNWRTININIIATRKNGQSIKTLLSCPQQTLPRPRENSELTRKLLSIFLTPVNKVIMVLTTV